MHHWHLLRVQQRTALCSPVSRLLWIASSGWRSGGYTTGAWHQHHASLLTKRVHTIILIIDRWHHCEYLFICKPDEADAVLWKLVQQLLASFQARVFIGCCQLLQTTLFQTLQLQVFVDNLNHRRFVYCTYPLATNILNKKFGACDYQGVGGFSKSLTWSLEYHCKFKINKV